MIAPATITGAIKAGGNLGVECLRMEDGYWGGRDAAGFAVKNNERL